MIYFESVSKYYKPDIIALQDVTFGIETAEFMFLTGPSGAGKSTLIRLLIRQETPSEGNITFDDTDVVSLKRTLLPFYRQQIGVVFQDYKLIELKTVRENIEFALEITGTPDSGIRDTTDSLLDLVGLEKRQHLFPDQLSGGEKQRAGIARALANDPKLLIADEPTGNLDPKTSLEIMNILQTINDWGTTVMIATHDREIVDEMGRRVVRLEDGKIVSDKVGKYNGDKAEKKTGKRTPSEEKDAPAKKEKAPEAPPAKMTEKIDLPEEKDADVPSSAATHSAQPLPGIETLSLPKKLIKQLEKNDITTIDTLLDTSEEELRELKGIGKKKAAQIIAALESFLSKTAQDEKEGN
jgi:cell division transport system ATP-binding protein